MSFHLDNYEFIINEIINILKDNLLLMNNRNDLLTNIKEYANNYDKKYIPYDELIYLTENALMDLINVEYLYDFRDLD